jgi:toxin HigB-1
MIGSFRSKALRRFYERGDASGLRPDWIGKVTRILDAMETAKVPDELGVPGFGFHALTGDMMGRYALTVSRNWRITFGWDGQDAIDIDLEDYHG